MSGYNGENVPSSQDTFDYGIVGAGSAGCVLANRLSADPSVRVLLLEAGPPDILDTIRVPVLWSGLIGSEVDCDYRLEPQPYYAGSDLYPRGKTPGGSSAINTMIYIRGHRTDFDGWSEKVVAAGITTRYCPTSSRPRATADSQHHFTAKKVRCASRTHCLPTSSRRAASVRPSSGVCRSTTTSTGRARSVRAPTNGPVVTVGDGRLPTRI